MNEISPEILGSCIIEFDTVCNVKNNVEHINL